LPRHPDGRWLDPAEPILTLHAHALLTVLQSKQARPQESPRARGESRQPFDQVAEGLFVHEQHRWQQAATQGASGVTDLTEADQTQVIAALLLASPTDHTEAVAVLRQLPDMADGSAERLANIARWAANLYPSDPQRPLQIKPDMLAEWFLVNELDPVHRPIG
jgi:hypothetical protein